MRSIDHLVCGALRDTALVAGLSLAGCGTALAQTPPPAAEAATLPDDTGNEIIVTAQRRSERLEDVPITLTAVSSETLQQAGITATSALGQVVPGFRLDYKASFAAPTIRGVSTSVAGQGGGSAVGIYVDGFYAASQLTTDFELLNVASIQVLKGPQGTLFGRNTTAGAVLVTSSEPSHTASGIFQASYARFNKVNLDGYVTAPLSDNLAVDLAALYRSGDGFLTNIANNDDKVGKFDAWSVRGGAKLEVGGSDYLLLRLSHSWRDDPASADLTAHVGDDGLPQTRFAGLPGALIGTDRRHIATDPLSQPEFTARVDAVQLTGHFDLDGLTLTSYSQYRKEKSTLRLDVDLTSAAAFASFLNFEDRLITQEFILNSRPGKRLSWTAGLFFMDQNATTPDFSLLAPALPHLYDTALRIRSYAAFVDLSYEVLDGLFLTAGARYSHETNKGVWHCTPTGIAARICPPGEQVNGSWNNFSPRFVVRQELNPNSSVYASFSKGYKAGLANPNGFQRELVEPERITAYEVGYKFGQRGTNIAASAFYYDYKNLQFSIAAGTRAILANAASSTIYGGEISASTQVGERLSLSGGIAYTHARFKDFPDAPGTIFRPGVGIDPTPVDASGNVTPRAPAFSGNVSATYHQPLAGGMLDLFGNVYYTSKFYFDPPNNYAQPQYAILNLRATWTDPTKRWALSLFGNNVTDTTYLVQTLTNSVSAGDTWGEPATYGVQVRYRW